MGKNKKANENNIDFKTIFTFFKSDKGKKISFVVFYFFFFLFLFIFFNTNKITTDNKKEESSLPFITSNLENNNYKFKYIVKSNNELLYLITKTNNYLIINDDTGEYRLNFKNGNLEDNNNIVIIHKELLNIFEVKRVIKNSKFISVTMLNETNEYMYNYTITNESLNNIFNNTISNKYLENEIIVKTNNKKEIEEIDFNLLNYEKELNSNLENFKITIIIGD